jgi:hypothetical protein
MVFLEGSRSIQRVPDPETKTFRFGTLIEITTVVGTQGIYFQKVTYIFLAVFDEIYVLARFLLNLKLTPNNVLGW